MLLTCVARESQLHVWTADYYRNYSCPLIYHVIGCSCHKVKVKTKCSWCAKQMNFYSYLLIASMTKSWHFDPADTVLTVEKHELMANGSSATECQKKQLSSYNIRVLEGIHAIGKTPEQSDTGTLVLSVRSVV